MIDSDYWRFSFTGEQLVPYVKAKYDALTEKERGLKTRIRNMNPAAESIISALEADAKMVNAERLLVYTLWRECIREPEEDYRVTLSEMAYFNIHPMPAV